MAVIHDGGIMANKALAFAVAQEGKPYVWGATGPDSFDCSGLVYRAYQAGGYQFAGRPTTATLVSMGDPVSSPLPGDLCFPDFSHVGICILPKGANGLIRVVEAPHTGDIVKQDYWKANLVACRRLSDPIGQFTPLPGTSAAGSAPTQTLVAGINIAAIQDAFTSVGGAAAWLSNGHNWLRIAYITGGVLLLIIALVAVLRHSGSVRSATKTVSGFATSKIGAAA